jgi:hypothetical protein
VNAPARALASSAARPVELRCSYIWRQEVMSDHVAATGVPVTLGSRTTSTFVTPKMGLPENFAILRPGARGWVLTLGTSMGGRLRIGGEEREVADFVARGGAGADAVEGSFRAAPVGPGDWGVIELDSEGDHVVFFHFVERDPPLPPPIWILGPLLAPALAFSVLLHGVFVTIFFLQAHDGDRMVFPGEKDLLSAYLVKRPPEEPPPEEPKPEAAAQAGKETEKEVRKPAATMGREGRAGGHGEKRSAAPEPKKGAPDKPINEGMLKDENIKTLQEIADIGGADEDFMRDMARLKRNQRTAGNYGEGRGSGGGYGDEMNGTGNTRGSNGTGSGGGGRSPDEIASQKGVKATGERAGKGVGGTAPREVKVERGEATGDFTGLSKADVDKVIKAASGAFRACYQDALNRSPDLTGKVVVSFVIKDDSTGPRGAGVTRASVAGGSTIGNKQVENCVVGKIKSLRFPAKGGAIVKYPFIFSNG